MQEDFPSLEVMDDRVTFRFEGFERTRKVPEDGKTLRAVAEELLIYPTVVQDLEDKYQSWTRCAS